MRLIRILPIVCLLIGSSAYSQYCIPAYNNIPCSQGTVVNDFIDNFWTTGGSVDISNLSSGCCINSTNLCPVALVGCYSPGQTFTVNMQCGAIYAQGFAVWIDWDQNFTFDATEKVYSSPTSGFGVYSGNVTVPAAQLPGVYRMRVRSMYATAGAAIGPCALGGFGETEDYDITIPSGGTAAVAGTASAAPMNICPGNDVDLTLTGYLGTTILWQSASNSGGPWTNVTGATAATFNTGPLNTSKCYRAIVMDCGPSDTSNVVCVSVGNYGTGVGSITNITNASCFNQCNGSVTVAMTGGAAPYVYTWSANTGFQMTPTAGNLCDGSYTVVITDDLNCKDTLTMVVTEPTQLQINNYSADTTICVDGSATLSATATGGTPGYTYNWNGIGVGQTQVLSPVANTTYQVFATDANNCISNTVSIDVSMHDSITADALPDHIICFGESTTLTATATGGLGAPYAFQWDNGAGSGNSVTVTPATTTTYTVSVTDGCESPAGTDEVTVTVSPIPNVTFTVDDPDGCDTHIPFFTNTTNPADVDQCEWIFGNGDTSDICGPVSSKYRNPGFYDVTLTVTSIDGCVGSTTISNMIEVFPDPIAEFTADPFETDLLDTKVTFTDLSSNDVIAWNWDFGGSGTSSLKDPVHVFPLDTGTYAVQLIVENGYGCFDTIYHNVILEAEFIMYIPNSFTPNGDGINDLFWPQVAGYHPDKYEFRIFDRWGQILWESTDPYQGWTGAYNNSSGIAKSGVYVYKIITTDQLGRVHQQIGHVNLIR